VSATKGIRGTRIQLPEESKLFVDPP